VRRPRWLALKAVLAMVVHPLVPWMKLLGWRGVISFHGECSFFSLDCGCSLEVVLVGVGGSVVSASLRSFSLFFGRSLFRSCSPFCIGSKCPVVVAFSLIIFFFVVVLPVYLPYLKGKTRTRTGLYAARRRVSRVQIEELHGRVMVVGRVRRG
jgi:hypothetical protein